MPLFVVHSLRSQIWLQFVTLNCMYAKYACYHIDFLGNFSLFGFFFLQHSLIIESVSFNLKSFSNWRLFPHTPLCQFNPLRQLYEDRLILAPVSNIYIDLCILWINWIFLAKIVAKVLFYGIWWDSSFMIFIHVEFLISHPFHQLCACQSAYF